MLPSDYACPRCDCRACYALHRKGIDWLISLMGLRPARCLTCSRRFYARYTMGENDKAIPSAASYAVSPVPAKQVAVGEHSDKALNTAA